MPAQQQPKSEVAALTESATITGEVFDADALFAEFKAKAKPFRFGGEVFMLPHPVVWPNTIGKAETLDEVAAAILGEEQYSRYDAAGGTIRFIQELARALHGVTLGESGASSSS